MSDTERRGTDERPEDRTSVKVTRGALEKIKSLVDKDREGWETNHGVVNQLLAGNIPVIAPDDFKKLQAMAARWSKGKMRIILGNLISVFAESDKSPGEFRDYVMRNKDKVGETERELEIPIDSCAGLVIITAAGDKKEYFNCVQGSKKGTVKIKKVTREQGEAEKVCLACKWRVNLEERWAEIQRVDRHGLEQHTYCSKGEEIDPETRKIKCRMMGQALGKTWFDQEDCFIVDEGRKCPNLKTLPAKEIKKTGITRRRKA